jgi:type IV pilus assembly protein PilB
MLDEPRPPADATRVESNSLAERLVRAGRLTDQQLLYARRIHQKMSGRKPLLQVLQHLGYVTEEQVRASLCEVATDLPIGVLLVELGHLERDALESALAIQKEEGGARSLDEILVENGQVDEAVLARTLSLKLGLRYVELDSIAPDAGLLAKAPSGWFAKHRFVPVSLEDDAKPLVAFAEPGNPEHRAAAETVFGGAVHAAIATPSAVRHFLGRAQKGSGVAYDEDTAAGIVDAILRDAVEAETSDVHIESLRDRILVRFRVDGVLATARTLDKQLGPAISSRLKVMAKADIAERRRHQDGRFLFDTGSQELDVRISFYVTVHGESIVMRLLGNKNQLVDLKRIGMTPRVLDDFVEGVLEAPSGVVLVTGPTGSGKTTTLYSCVHQIQRSDMSIITAEHPVEYVIDGISQCSIDPSIGVTFEETLRHIVRQDPDVIVIGEIRDRFSAEAAIQSALTGHKVLTTFHTEDSIGGLLRLMNMDIEAFLISSTVVSVVAQRLLRKVCAECSEDYAPTPRDLRMIGWSARELAGATFRLGRGCGACHHSGFRGRVGIFEVLVLNEPVRAALLRRSTSHEIRDICTETTGMLSLVEDGLLKAARGVTTISEVIRTLPRLRPPRPLAELQRLAGS